MKEYLICTVRSDGRADIQDHTNLLSEAERFEELGYEVVPSAQFPEVATSRYASKAEWVAA